ncbi:Lrp/AsnC family transcriptional regulator [Kordiimonas pumila]|uniref:Lrp/AsnC family transcriptional regulator n=1 Tax=Kordiimonas pumila TaxID=2161677 RepID=A0ABV7D4S8_9PROT|nr:Lrp/AsnC family transcriptional regulator [Kordiimonas pumila]
MEIDQIDKKILALLTENCKLSSQQIAEQVGASTASCWRRIKAMEDAGVIESYQATINHDAVGFELTAFAQVTLNRHSKNNVKLFEEAVGRMPEILACYSVTGQYDYILHILVKNIRDYELFLNDRVFHLPGVDHVHSSISMKTVKTRQSRAA